MANALLDSATPRRLTAASRITKTIAISTRNPFRKGSAEMMLSTPLATDTTTVIT
jgi:hypothetical protein